jgi:hypothetical protein
VGFMYSVGFRSQTITNAGGDRDFFYFAPADDKPVTLYAIIFSPAAPGDLGDAQEETLPFAIIRGHTTVSSGGSSVTAANVYRTTPNAPDPGATIRTNDTTIASAGTTFSCWDDAFNIRVGSQLILPETIRPRCSQAEGSIVVRLLTAPADDIVMSMTVWFEEGI